MRWQGWGTVPGVNTRDVFFTRFTSNLFLGACSVEEKAKLKIIINFYQSSQKKATGGGVSRTSTTVSFLIAIM